ncbi:hypothetical protein DSO57_1034136 [Entomophthora muscae]|uniref:Uncharacterized protein n=1 Tax=Entomophthora muscae TaxID=34485 RepID=A0ACC2SZU9_9FUNG|nr:hypothetical protein DSO57_1034136 [Entomophthora muscae]
MATAAMETSTQTQIKEMLIEEFGGYLSLEVKKNAFVSIVFKPKEILVEFYDCFYIEEQQVITSQQLSIREVYITCPNDLKVNQLLCLHFKAHKPMLTSIKGIKTLL